MSDFDKEAEREKLRERFAEEDEKRETTEQMSELLLQGATMTDTHCDTCGNPLFRYEGQTFCPNCQQATTEGETTTASDEQTPANTTERQTATEQSNPQRDRSADRTPQQTPERPKAGTPSQHTPPSQTSDTDETRTRQSETTTHTASGTDDLGAAEASLSRTLRELTTTAEETADLGRRREHLAAAREAAEALDAVRTARK